MFDFTLNATAMNRSKMLLTYSFYKILSTIWDAYFNINKERLFFFTVSLFIVGEFH